MSGVKPALTAEQWRFADDAAVTLIVEHPNAHETMGRHGAAALCLHGQPFGFTREDVEDARKAIGDVHAACNSYCVGECGCSALAERLNALSDRIEALLPPEGDA